MFFDWQDNQQPINSGLLKDMRVSSTMIEVQRDVGAALKATPGPYFLGPRMEFDYAVYGLPSPRDLPVYWQAGTSFPVSDQTRLIDLWEEHQFQTLIFLKVDNPWRFEHAYYSQEFFDAIRRGYVEDLSYPLITVYHKRVTESGQP
jgi:hypothetical protein